MMNQPSAAERLYYADVYANIVKTGASPSDSLDVADRESQRPETEVIKHQGISG